MINYGPTFIGGTFGQIQQIILSTRDNTDAYVYLVILNGLQNHFSLKRIY